MSESNSYKMIELIKSNLSIAKDQNADVKSRSGESLEMKVFRSNPMLSKALEPVKSDSSLPKINDKMRQAESCLLQSPKKAFSKQNTRSTTNLGKVIQMTPFQLSQSSLKSALIDSNVESLTWKSRESTPNIRSGSNRKSAFPKGFKLYFEMQQNKGAQRSSNQSLAVNTTGVSSLLDDDGPESSTDQFRYYKLNLINSRNLSYALMTVSAFVLLMYLVLFLLDRGMIWMRLDYTHCLTNARSLINNNSSTLVEYTQPAFFTSFLKRIRKLSNNVIAATAPDSTDVGSASSSLSQINRCSQVLDIPKRSACSCVVFFDLPQHAYYPVHLYYGLESFFQSNRFLFNSRSDAQLLGNNDHRTRAECKSLQSENRRRRNDPTAMTTGQDQVKQISAPCGTMAAIMFNDTFALYWKEPYDNQNWITVPISRDQIALPEDRFNYANPSNWSAALAGTIKPNNWPLPLNELGNRSVPTQHGYKYEPFQVWMYTAPLPTFIKIFGRLWRPLMNAAPMKHNNSAHMNSGGTYTLPAGRYMLRINYTYPLWSNQAAKFIVVASSNMFGHSNANLQLYLLATGFVSFMYAVLLLVIRRVDNRHIKRLNKYRIKINF